MKKIVSLISCIIAFIPLCVMAQKYATQTGLSRQIQYEASDKTLPIPGVRVTIGTEIRSDNNGNFSAQVPLNPQHTYRITSIKPPTDEYIVVYPEGSTAEYVLKSDPFLIVIANKSAIAKEQQAIERRLNDTLRLASNRLLELYEQQKELLETIDEDDARYAQLEDETQNLRQKLKYYYDKEQAMHDEVTKIAYRLACTDAGMLDETGQKHLRLRRNGEWNKLLSELNDSLPSDMQHLKQLIDFQQQKVAKDSIALSNDTEEYLKRLNHFCRNMEERIEAFTMTFQNDSVAHCYELLTKVAPDNWQYFNEFGYFELAFRANIDESLALLDKALTLASDTKKEIKTLNHLLSLYDIKCDYKNLAAASERIRQLIKAEDLDIESAMAAAFTFSTIMPELGEAEATLQVIDDLMPIAETYFEGTPAHALLLLNKAHAQDKMGRYDQALPLYRKALKIIDPEYQDTHLMPVGYYNAAMCCVNLSKSSLALTYLTKADEASKRLYGDEHYMSGKIKNAYGMIYALSGDFDKAKESMMQGLAINKALFGEEHRTTAQIYNNLGYLMMQQKQYSEAAKMFGKALRISKLLLGDKHVDVATMTGNLGYAQALDGDGKGYDNLLKAIDILRGFNPDHPEIGRCLNDLSHAYAMKGDGETALDYGQQAVDHYEKHCNALMPDKATAYNNLGFILLRYCQYDKAEKALTKAIETYDRIYGKDYIETHKPLGLLGEVYLSIGEYDKALEHYGKALALLSATYSDTHPDAMFMRHMIATTKGDMGRIEESISDYESLIKIEEGLRPNSNLLYNLNLNIGKTYMDLHEYDKCIHYTQEAYTATERANILDNSNLIPYYCNMGLCLLYMNDYQAALDNLRKGLQLCDETYQYKHEVRAILLDNIGLTYSSLSDLENAEKCYRESLDIYQQIFQTDMPSMANIYTNLSNLLINKGELAEGKEYFRRGYDLFKRQYGENSQQCYTPYYNYVTAMALIASDQETIADASKLLEIARTVYGPRHANVAEAESVIASLLTNSGQMQEALPYYQQAEEIYSEIGDYDQPIWLSSCVIIASNYNDDPQLALKWFTKAADIANRASNPDPNIMASVYIALSGLYVQMGDSEPASKYANLYVDFSEKAIGTQSPQIIQPYFYAGAIYLGIKDNDKAIEMFQRALNVSKSTFGEDHELTKTLLQQIKAIKENIAK